MSDGDQWVRPFEIHSADGPRPTNIWMERKKSAYMVQKRDKKGKPMIDKEGKPVMTKMTKSQQEEQPVWTVSRGGEPVKEGMTEADAKEFATGVIHKDFKSDVPTDIKVREYSIDESPISQFGLKKNLHRQCNTFNWGAGACGKCQGCRTWLNDEMLRATKSLVPGTTIKLK